MIVLLVRNGKRKKTKKKKKLRKTKITKHSTEPRRSDAASLATEPGEQRTKNAYAFRHLSYFITNLPFKAVSERKHSKETGGPRSPWHGRSRQLMLSPVYQSFLCLHARCQLACCTRVHAARVKECQALGGNIWRPRTREPRSRVELEPEWCSTRASRRNIKRFRAFELSREADDVEDRRSKERGREKATSSGHVAPRAHAFFSVHPFRFVRLEMPNKRSSSVRDAIQRRFARLQTLHDRTAAPTAFVLG